MISTAENGSAARLLPDDREGPVSTDIVKGPHELIFTQDHENAKASNIIDHIVAGGAKASAVAYTYPCLLMKSDHGVTDIVDLVGTYLAEDCPSLKLESNRI